MSITRVNAATGEVDLMDEVAPSFPPSLDEFRAKAYLPRYEFLAACVTAGIITQETAEEAADGSWPAAFDTFLTGLADTGRITAKAVWADGKVVKRNSTILALIAADASVTEEQLDVMFGYA